MSPRLRVGPLEFGPAEISMLITIVMFIVTGALVARDMRRLDIPVQ